MNSAVTRQLNQTAAILPLVYEVKPDKVVMTGEEMNLSGYGEFEKFDKDKFYDVPIPKYVAVEHKQQLKDAFKKEGIRGVKNYVKKVKEMAGI